MNDAIRASFPAARSGVYLNSAAVGPVSTEAVEAVREQLDEVSCSGARRLTEWLGTKERVRCLVASMLGGNGSDVAFTRNTTDGLCAVASGLQWKQGDNIVSFENEFPANYYPWLSVRDRVGVELRLCREVDGRVDIEQLCSLIDSRTRVVTLSAVQYGSGFRLDLERVGKIARKHDAIFVVDIIQGFGAMPFDLPAQYVDVAAGASYKWLCAPEGCGIFYVGSRARDRIRPSSLGWTCYANPWNFAERDQPTLSSAQIWETGMGGTALLCGLEASLELLRMYDLHKIESYLGELTDFLCEIVPTARYAIASSRVGGEKSQIVCLRPLNGHTAEAIVGMLRQQRICVSSRAGTIRVAPHFFNTYDDLEIFVEALP